MPGHDLITFNRITELVTLLGLSQYTDDEEFILTVTSISRATETSVRQTRKDISGLDHAGLTVLAFPSGVSADGIPLGDLPDFGADERYDDCILRLDAECIPGADYFSPYLLFLNGRERELFTSSKLKDLRIKQPAEPVKDISQILKALKKAMAEHCRVSFRYPDRDGRFVDAQIEPQLLYHNTTDDIWYCISFPDDEHFAVFRLDRIRDGIEPVHIFKDKTFVPAPPDDPRLIRFAHVWGAAFAEEEIIHVKIRISGSLPNIISKIRSDTRERKFGRLYKDDEYYFYEDDIIGVSAFRAWLYTFGSAVKVLEPDFLAEDMLTKSRNRLAYYEAGTFPEEVLAEVKSTK